MEALVQHSPPGSNPVVFSIKKVVFGFFIVKNLVIM
jgi:hypothetical protein